MNVFYRNGRICIWECTVNPDDLVQWKPPLKKKKLMDSDSEDDIDTSKAVEKPKARTLNDRLLESGEKLSYFFQFLF